MRSWLLENPAWRLLHDPGLRTRHTYLMSRRTTTASGRSTTVIRLLCCVIVSAAGLWAVGPTASAWWLAVIALPFFGTVLALIHAREEIIERMTQSRLVPIRALGRELTSHGWNRVNLPGVLETFGPLLMAWMVGAPDGPFAGHPAAKFLGVAATLLYSGLGTLHWAIESIFYQYEPTKAWPVWFARLARGGAPLVLGPAYAFLFSRNSDAATATLPWLAAIFLLLYPAVTVFEQILVSAEIERFPAIMAQRLKDATVVHSSISNPLHFVLMATRNRPAGDAEPLMIYLRGELERCLHELDHGHEPASVGEIVEGVRGSLLPEDRQRLLFDDPGTLGELTAVDASLVRSVLADLCCNALKEVRDGHQPSATVTAERDESTITLEVADDGPGLAENWEMGSSLRRLRSVLRTAPLDGDLTYRTNQPTGSTARVHWKLDAPERAR